MTAMTDLFGPIISTYTRADAIGDGTLVDVTETAREAGFKIPVALTRAVWTDCVEWTDATDRRKHEFTGQDEAGRLWDVVWVARVRAARAPATDRVPFRVLRVPPQGRGLKARLVSLVAHVGPGDNAEPVITIMQPDES